jgi:hypothetical protein
VAPSERLSNPQYCSRLRAPLPAASPQESREERQGVLRQAAAMLRSAACALLPCALFRKAVGARCEVPARGGRSVLCPLQRKLVDAIYPRHAGSEDAAPLWSPQNPPSVVISDTVLHLSLLNAHRVTPIYCQTASSAVISRCPPRLLLVFLG